MYVTSSLNTLVSAVLPPAWWGTARPSGGFSRPQSDDVEQVWNPPPGKGPWPPLFALPYSLLQVRVRPDVVLLRAIQSDSTD